MRRFRLIVPLAALLGGSVLLQAQDLVLGRLSSYFESLRVQAGIPGLAGSIIGPDDIVWEQAFGSAGHRAVSSPPGPTRLSISTG